jgi:hypothetical protein
LVDRASPVIGRVILDDLEDQAIGPATLVDRADPVIGQEISAGQANQAETLFKISPAASATTRDGRIGVRSIVTISETGGKTMLATSTIGTTTPGGMTTTLTGRTIQDSVTGDGLHGTG